MTSRTSSPLNAPARLNLALQGGGAHGAFTWGVLDRLLDEEDLALGSISGSSAGALNAAALATGWRRGGREGAKAHLELLWTKVAQAGSLMTFFMLPLRKPGMGLWDDALPVLSPHQANPLGTAPLRYVLESVVDEAVLRDPGPAPAVYVNAVRVATGATRVFGPGDISMDALLASACAPFSYQAVQIDGDAYWDGSYAANPSLWPLYRRELDTDILLVELTPPQRAETPQSAKNILNRINELASLQGLAAELNALDAVNQHVPGADVRLHVVSIAQQPRGALTTEPSIKRTVDRVLFEWLRQEGRQACAQWLAEHRSSIGQRSSVDIAARYLPFQPVPPEARRATASAAEERPGDRRQGEDAAA